MNQSAVPACPRPGQESANRKLVDLTGQRFGRLVVIERAPNRGVKVAWLCQCDCGGTREVTSHTLRYNKRPTRSCGCLERERQIDRTSAGPACGRTSGRYPSARTGTAAGYAVHHYLGERACDPCLSAQRENNAQWKADNAAAVLRRGLWTKYRLTMERYEALLAEQDGRCGICGSDDPGDVRAGRFHIDHDHGCCPGDKSCGQCVRGLLCRGCNTALGNFADDRERLLRAIDYLDRRRGEPLPEAAAGAPADAAAGGTT